MKHALNILALALCLSLPAEAVNVFAKGAFSKTFQDKDQYTLRYSASGGFGFRLFSMVKLETRYTRVLTRQNQYAVTGLGIVTDQEVKTDIYSIGLDISFAGRKRSVQPFIFVGGGYVISELTADFTDLNSTKSNTYRRSEGVTLNGGAGIRIRMSDYLAFEVEGFGYLRKISENNPLLDLYATIGIRIFL